MKRKRVLITGASGVVGTFLWNALANKYELSGLSKDPVSYPNHFVLNITNMDEIRPVFRDKDVVIHLAGSPSVNASWKEVLENNIIGTYNVYEATRLERVGRLILASSNHVTGQYENDPIISEIVRGDYKEIEDANIPKIDHLSPIRPDSLLGVSKAFGEALGRLFSEVHGISVICLRLGTIVPWDHPRSSIRHYATWMSSRDLVQMIEKSIEVENIRFAIFYGVSNNRWRFWDISYAKDILGFEPRDNAEDFRLGEDKR